MQNNPILKLNLLLLSLNPYEFTTLAYLIGLILSDGLDYNQLQSLGNFFEQIGQTLLTIGQQWQTLDEYSYQSPQIESIIDVLKNKIGNIERIIADFKNL